MQRCAVLVSLFVLAAFSLPSVAYSQLRWHNDGQGYSMKSGNSTYSFRNDGSSAQFHRFGNIDMRIHSNGTQGMNYYGQTGTFHSYSNPQNGWSGSGYTPYSNPAASTYRRNYAPSLPRYSPWGN